MSDLDKLRIEPPSPSVVQRCADPVQIPITRNQSVQEAAWRRDRVALAECRDKHSVLVQLTENIVGTLNE